MLMVSSSEGLLQFDRRLGRHAWLQLTSLAAIERARSVVERTPSQAVIYDPFSGSATTGVIAANLGRQAFLSDINPFWVWLGAVKSRNHGWGDLATLQVRLDRLRTQLRSYADVSRKNWQPPSIQGNLIWSPEVLHVLSAIRRTLAEEYGESSNRDGQTQSLIWVAFCQLLLETTEASLPPSSGNLVDALWYAYQEILDRVVESVADALTGPVQVFQSDARQAPSLPARATHVVATPPAPDRQSEIKRLVPFMYWLRFLESLEEAGEREWKAIGGIWGYPPRYLATWRPTIRELAPALVQSIRQIRQLGNVRSAALVAQFFLKYFHDLHLHLMNLRGALADDASLYYFTSNTSYKGVPIPSEHILKETLHMLGYKKVFSQPVSADGRAAREFCVLARYDI